jgi:hypothetical protein
MTTPSPYKVSYTVEAEVFTGTEHLSLNVKSARVSVDADRINFTEATLEIGDVTDEQWEAMDPRSQNPMLTQRLRIHIRQYDEDGDFIGGLPPHRIDSSDNTVVRLWMRTATRDYITGDVTITAASGESMMTDKLSIATADVNTGATTVSALVYYCLFNVFGGVSVTEDDPTPSMTNIPAGDRRLRLIGNDMLETCRNELDALNDRLSDYFGDTWYVEHRSKTPPETWKLATFTQEEGAPVDADPIVLTMRQELTRDGDFADGVLAEFNWTNSAGTRTVDYHITGGGANT